MSELQLLRPKHHGLDQFSNSPLPLAASSSSKEEIGSSSPKQGQLLRQFTIAEIRSATRDFREDLVLGEGSSGKVYKGIIGTTFMAVKRWNSGAAREFKAEFHLLSMLQHPNILRLIGYCTEGEEMIVAYEYISNGSLEDHLHNRRTPLSWSVRLKICIDVARALDYLHKGIGGQVVIYNNVKTSNILLDSEWAAKISDLGLSKIIPGDTLFTTTSVSTRVSTEVADTYGYVDPEYLVIGRLSKKSDVYSFGMVLLEVLSRRRGHVEQIRTVESAKYWMTTGTYKKVTDPELKGQISRKTKNHYVRIMEGCLREGQERRVTMAEVVFGLESILASHEGIDAPIPQMSITTSYSRLQNIFSSGYNSGKAKTQL